MNRSQIVLKGIPVAAISALTSPIMDVVTTGLFAPGSFVSIIAMNAWLNTWTFYFSGSIFNFLVINVVSIIAVVYYWMGSKNSAADKITLSAVMLLVWNGLCQIANSTEDWLGVAYRHLLHYDLINWDFDIYRQYGFAGLMPAGSYWVPIWVYVLSRIGAGLLLVCIGLLLLYLMKGGKIAWNPELQSNFIILITSAALLVLPLFFKAI